MKTRPFKILALFLIIPSFVASQDLITAELTVQDVSIPPDFVDRNFEIIQENLVAIDQQVLNLDQINFNLFDGISFLGQRDRNIKVVDDADWIGRLEGIEGGYAMITKREEQLFVKIETGSRQFFIYTIGDAHKLVEVNRDAHAEELLDDGIILHQVNNLDVCAAADTCAPVCVSTLVVYTPAAMANLGGNPAGAEAAIGAAVNEFNMVLDNSGVTHDVCLVHTEDIAYTESGSTSTDVAALRNMTDGVIDNIHSLRNTFSADLVHMIVASGCGSGYVNNDPLNYRDDLAFAVTSDNCMTTNLTFSHEAGHNLGLHHDWFVNASTDPCEWHHGFVNDGAAGDRWRTVMAYNQECASQGFSCPRQPYLSNPANTFGPNNSPMGITMGSPNPSNSSFGVERAMCDVADFRIPTSLPVEFSSFSSIVSNNDVLLQWTTQSEYNNAGFAIEHSTKAGEFAELGFVEGEGNSVEQKAYSFSVSDLEVATHRFRLKQQDFDGSVEYSEVIETKILLPEGHILNPAYPNPFNPTTTMTFVVAESNRVQIQLVNIYGQVVREIYRGTPPAQELQTVSVSGEGLASGVYHLVLTSGSRRSSQKLVLQK